MAMAGYPYHHHAQPHAPTFTGATGPWSAAGPFGAYSAAAPTTPAAIHGVRQAPTHNPDAFGIATGVPGPFVRQPAQPATFQAVLPRGEGIPINLRRYARPHARVTAPAAKPKAAQAPKQAPKKAKAPSSTYYDGYYDGGSYYDGGYYDYYGYGGSYYDGKSSYYGGNSEYYYN